MTAQIVPFPQPYRPVHHNYMGEPCSIIIMPVVRIERPDVILEEQSSMMRQRFNRRRPRRVKRRNDEHSSI